MKIMATMSKNEAVSKNSNSYVTKLNVIFIDDVLMQKCTSSYNDYNLINTYMKLNVKHHIILVHSCFFTVFSHVVSIIWVIVWETPISTKIHKI